MTSTDHALAARLTELEASLDATLPAGGRAAFAAEREQLDAAGLPAGIAGVGTPVPDAPLLDVHGDPTTLAEATGGGFAMVVRTATSRCGPTSGTCFPRSASAE